MEKYEGNAALLPAAFRLFDRMMLLLRGRVVYFGARGAEATDYFKAVPLPEGHMMTSLAEGANEAEWIVDITTQADRQERCAPLPLTCRDLYHTFETYCLVET